MWHSLDKLELAEHFLAMRQCEVIVVTVIQHRAHTHILYIFRAFVCVCVCVCACVLDVGGSGKRGRDLQVLAHNKKSRVVFRTRHLQMR